MDNDKNRKTLPPYVSYRTFRNFIDGLQMGMPARIDRSYWGERYSGSTGTQLMTALRFLELVDSSGTPTLRLRQLVSAKGTQRNEILKQVVHSAFDFVSDRTIDPQVATYAQLEEAFYSAYQVTGDVARKCIKFFISLESDAGVTLSPYIMRKSKTIRTNGSRKATKKNANTGTNRNAAPPPVTDNNISHSTWQEKVLEKFPTFDPAWPDEVKLKWFEAFNTLLNQETSPNRQT
jgi:hypothetical protein